MIMARPQHGDRDFRKRVVILVVDLLQLNGTICFDV